MNISWDAEGYRRNFSFVPAYGGAVVDLVGAGPGARCLDLSCGSGALTAELAERGLDVVGMDASPEAVAALAADRGQYDPEAIRAAALERYGGGPEADYRRLMDGYRRVLAAEG